MVLCLSELLVRILPGRVAVLVVVADKQKPEFQSSVEKMNQYCLYKTKNKIKN